LTFLTVDIVLDPTRKLTYVKAAWDATYVKVGLDTLQRIVAIISSQRSPLQLISPQYMKYYKAYHSKHPTNMKPGKVSKRPSRESPFSTIFCSLLVMMSLSDHSETNDWMDAIINNGNNGVAQPPKESEDPFHELNEYLGSPPVS